MDNIAKDLYKYPYSDGYEGVKAVFGWGIVERVGSSIDTAKLGKIVFNSRKAMKLLNKVMIPIIVYNVGKTIKEHEGENIVLDGALLLDTPLKDYCDIIIYIDAPKKVRRARLINRGVNPSIADKMAEAVTITTTQILKNDKPVIVINNDSDTKSLVEKLSKISKINIDNK
jgi:dephospho-CoA kinase